LGSKGYRRSGWSNWSARQVTHLARDLLSR
jgi:hypothetical protein